MFRPNQKAVVRQTGETVTVVGYETRTQVNVETDDGQPKSLKEGALRRPLTEADISKIAYNEPKHEPPDIPELQELTEALKSEEATRRYMERRKKHDEVRDILVAKVKGREISIDWSGHNNHIEDDERHTIVCSRMDENALGMIGGFPMPLEDLAAFKTALESGEALDEPVDIGTFLGTDCGVCGNDHYKMRAVSDGVSITVDDRCPLAEWEAQTKVEMNIPSGKLLVTNDLRELTGLPIGGREIGGAAGRDLATVTYGRAGLGHGYVGNTSPNFYRVDGTKDSYVIANVGDEESLEDNLEWVLEYIEETRQKIADAEGSDDLDDQRMSNYRLQQLPRLLKRVENLKAAIAGDGFKGEELAEVVTDLWWYSIMDYEEAARRAVAFGEFKTEKAFAKMVEKGWTYHVVDITPGLYLLTHDHNATDEDEPTIWATFERIGDARDDWPDYVAIKKNFQVTAAQACYAYTYRWDDRVYGGKRKKREYTPYSMANAANQFFTTGRVPIRDWHPNGFPNRFTPWDADLPSVEEAPEIVPFHFQTHWSDIGDSNIKVAANGRDDMFKGDCPLNESFARLAFNVLESLISYAHPVEQWSGGAHGPTYKLPHKKMRDAVPLYHKLARRYPDQVDPDFFRWLQDKAAVRRWIANWFHGFTHPSYDLKPGIDVKFDRYEMVKGELVYKGEKKGQICTPSKDTLKKLGIKEVPEGQWVVAFKNGKGKYDRGYQLCDPADITFLKEGGKSQLTQAEIDAIEEIRSKRSN